MRGCNLHVGPRERILHGMRHQTDYVLRLIEQLGALVRATLEKAGLKETGEPLGVAAQAIGLALSMEPDLASGLSPGSLASLLRLGEVDGRVVSLVARALEIEATALEAGGKAQAARFRREQSAAALSVLEGSSEPD